MGSFFVSITAGYNFDEVALDSRDEIAGSLSVVTWTLLVATTERNGELGLGLMCYEKDLLLSRKRLICW